jgi:hypothetical protein
MIIAFILSTFTIIGHYLIYDIVSSFFLAIFCLIILVLLVIDYTKIDENSVKHRIK